MQHTGTKDGGVITWDSEDFKAGLGAQGTFSTNTVLKQVEKVGWNYLANINPFIQYGVLQAGKQPSTAFTNNSNLGGCVIATQNYSTSQCYSLDLGGVVNNISFTTNVVSNSSPFPHIITGTTPIGQDCLLYAHNSGGTADANQVTSLFYSYYNTANWDVGAFVNLTTFDDDFMSDIPDTPLDITSGDGDSITQKTAPHTLCIGADGILYIGSGRYVHAYDGFTGADGTFSSQVLKLPQGFQIIGMRKYQDVLLIAGNYYSTSANGLGQVGQAQLYTWNYIDADIDQFIPLEDPYVSSLFIWNGNIAVITNGITERNGANKVKIVTGISTKKIGDFDGIAPCQRGVLTADDLIYINSGGKIISLGDKFEESQAVNHIASCRTSGVSGIVDWNYQTNGGTLMASSSNGAAGVGTPSFNNLNQASGLGSAYGFYFQPQFPIGKEGRIKTVQIDFFSALAASGNNGNLTLDLSVDYGANSTQVLTNLASVVTPLLKRYTLSSTGTPFPRFSSIAPQFSWNPASLSAVSPYSPQIASLTVEYENIEIPKD